MVQLPSIPHASGDSGDRRHQSYLNQGLFGQLTIAPQQFSLQDMQGFHVGMSHC
jgi:hypothetical protein